MKKLFLAVVFVFSFLLPLFLFAQPSPQPPRSCHSYTAGSAIPEGFGSPIDVAGGGQLLIKVTCTSSAATVTVQNQSQLQYNYHKGYVSTPAVRSWQQVGLASQGTKVSDVWYPQSASLTVSRSDGLATAPYYILAYTCAWTGAQWKCGCRDSACATKYWQIQKFQFTDSPTLPPKPWVGVYRFCRIGDTDTYDNNCLAAGYDIGDGSGPFQEAGQESKRRTGNAGIDTFANRDLILEGFRQADQEARIQSQHFRILLMNIVFSFNNPVATCEDHSDQPASPGGKRNCFPEPGELQLYKGWLKFMVQRYDGDCDFNDDGDCTDTDIGEDGTPNPAIHWFMPGNEVDNPAWVTFGTWHDTPENFARLVRVISETIKSVDPHAKMVHPSFSTPFYPTGLDPTVCDFAGTAKAFAERMYNYPIPPDGKYVTDFIDLENFHIYGARYCLAPGTNEWWFSKWVGDFYQSHGKSLPPVFINEDGIGDSKVFAGLGLTKGEVWNARGQNQDAVVGIFNQISRGLYTAWTQGLDPEGYASIKLLLSKIKGLDPSSAKRVDLTPQGVRKDVYLISMKVNQKPIQALWWDQRSVLNVINRAKSSFTEEGTRPADNLLSTSRFWFWANNPGTSLQNTFVFNTYKEIKTIGSLAFYNSFIDSPSQSTKEVRVAVSTDGVTYTPVTFTDSGTDVVILQPGAQESSGGYAPYHEEPQIFKLSNPVQARHVKVITLSNYSNPTQISMNKVQAFEPDQSVTIPVEATRVKVTNLISGAMREYDTPSRTLTFTIDRDPVLIEGL